MKTNKIVVLLMALIMVLTMVPAFAESDATLVKEWVHLVEGEHTCSFATTPDSDPKNYYTETDTDKATGIVSDIQKTATCTEGGTDLQMFKCVEEVCDSRAYKLYTTSALDHDMPAYANFTKVEAAAGYLAYDMKDGKIVNDYRNAEKPLTTATAVAKTATTNGLDVYVGKCSRCDYQEILLNTLSSGNAVAGDCVIKEDVLKVTVMPTHTTDGEGIYITYCANEGHDHCGKEIDRWTGKIEKNNVHEIIVNTFYEEAGFYPGDRINNIKAKMMGGLVIDGATIKVVEASCKNNGVGSVTITCTAPDCKAVLLTETVVDSIEHVLGRECTAEEHADHEDCDGNCWVWYEWLDETPATCTENGWVMAKCQICKQSITEVVEALGHDYVDGYVQYGKAFTYEKNGNPDRCAAYTSAKVCVRNTWTTTEGAMSTVKTCGHYELTGKEVAAEWTHAYTLSNIDTLEKLDRVTLTNDTRKTTDCNVTKSVVVTCKDCGYKTTVVAAEAGHIWKDISTGKTKVEQKCNQDGIIVVECVNYADCLETKEINIGKAPHVETNWGDDDIACGQTSTKLIVCKNCQAELRTETVVAAHKFNAGATGVNMKWNGSAWVRTDCTKAASVTGTCVKCGVAGVSNKFEATSHTRPATQGTPGDLDAGKNVWVNIPATCWNVGKEMWDCTVCDMALIIKTADMLEHFAVDKDVDDIKEATCQETGLVVETCGTCILAGKTEKDIQTRESITPIVECEYTKIVGDKKVCKWCGEAADVVDGHNFSVITTGINLTSTSTSGRGKIEYGSTHWEEIWNNGLYARINFNFQLDNGESQAYVACVEIDENGEFRMASPACPYGAKLTNVTIMITSDADAQDKLISDVPNYGVTVLR